MPFEAKFLNLSSDNYTIEIIDPTTFDISDTVKINATENKSIKSYETRISFYLKNDSNKKEKLFFDLPEIELYTIDKDYTKDETIIKNDMQNKKYYGESVTISETDFTIELQRRSSVNTSPELRFKPTNNPTELNITLKNETTEEVKNTTASYKPAQNNPYPNQNTVIKTTSSSGINPYAKSYGSNLASTVTSTVSNSNGNYNSYRPPNSSSVGATIVKTNGNYNNYKPVLSTSVDNVTQMSKSVYDNSYVPSNCSRGYNPSTTYSYGNVPGNTYQSNTNTPVTTSNYGFTSTGNFGSKSKILNLNLTKSLNTELNKTKPSTIISSNPYSARNTTKTTTSEVENKPTIQTENINATTRISSNTPYNYSKTPSSYQTSTYNKYNPNNFNTNSVTYQGGAGTSNSTCNYSQAKTITYQPTGNIDYNKPKYMDPSMAKSIEFRPERNNQYTSDSYTPSTQNLYSSTSSSYYNSTTFNPLKTIVENSIGKVIRISSMDSSYKSKIGSKRIVATVTTDGKKLSELKDEGDENAESKIETVTNIKTIASTEIGTNSEKIINTNTVTGNVLNNPNNVETTIVNITSKNVENVEPVNAVIVSNVKNDSVKGQEISGTTIITKSENTITANTNRELNPEVIQDGTTTINNISNMENVNNQGTTITSTLITKSENNESSQAKGNLVVSPVKTETNTERTEVIQGGTTTINNISNMENVDNQGTTISENNESQAKGNLVVSPAKTVIKTEITEVIQGGTTTINNISNMENVDNQGTNIIPTVITKSENNESQVKGNHVASPVKTVTNTERTEVIQGGTTINNISNMENVDNQVNTITSAVITKSENDEFQVKGNYVASSDKNVTNTNFNIDSYVAELMKSFVIQNPETSKKTENVITKIETEKESLSRKTSFFDIESILQLYKIDSAKNNNEIVEDVQTFIKQSSAGKLDNSFLSNISKEEIEHSIRKSLPSNVSLKNYSEENSLKNSPDMNYLIPTTLGATSSFEINLNHSPDLSSKRKESIKITKKQNELIKKLSINISDKEKIAEIAGDEEKKSNNKSENISINFSAIEKNKNLIENYEKSISKIISSIKFEEGFDIYESSMKNKISIMNMDNEEVYVRVNGNTEKEEELNLLKPNEMLNFDRESNKIHKLQICADKFSKRGPVYNVYANCNYKIIKHQLQNESSGDFVSLSANRFFENNNNNNKYFLTFSESSLKNYNNILSLKNQQYISLFNASSNQIKIRIEADKTNDDDVVIIYPLMAIAIQKQNPQYEYLTEIKQGEKIKKYMLKTNNVFSFDDEGLLIDASNKDILNPVSNVLRINNEISLKNKNIVSNKNEYVNKEKEEYFEYEELNFDDENFNEFCLDNFCGEDIYIRVEKQGEGDEDFFLLKNGDEKWTLREDGLFLLEIVRSNLLSKRFVVNTNYCYTIDKDFNFRESNTMKLVPQTFDRFRGFNLEIKGKTCTINYNADNNSVLIDNQEDSDLIYFYNIPSNYNRNKKFTDETFPASVDIIATKEDTHYPHSCEEVSEKILNNIVFKRPNEIFDENVFLFNDNNNDELSYRTFVTQILNAINNDNPANIKKMIKSKEINPQGYYEVYFFDKDRKKKIMFIDDNFPVDKTNSGSDRHFFSECNSNEIWLQILEKAFAKYEGGYSNIMDGNIINELYFFTGAISFRFEINDPNSWDYLKASGNPSTITLATMKKDQTNEIKGIGMFENVFSILNVREYYEPEEEQNIKLIKMRNLNVNSTNNIYSYSSGSKKWTTELKKFFNTDNSFKDKHVFFITFEEFQKDFDSFITSYIN